MEASLIHVWQDFSVQGHKDWSFRIKIYLKAHHYRMWEVIENCPIIIYEQVTTTTKELSDITQQQKPKDPSEYSTDDRKVVGLGDFAKWIISSTVKGVYLAKIRNLETAKEMWDALKAISQGLEEMIENKLAMACNKLDDFKMLHEESIEQMINWFVEITLEIASINADKYTLRELNQKWFGLYPWIGMSLQTCIPTELTSTDWL